MGMHNIVALQMIRTAWVIVVGWKEGDDDI